MAGQFRIYVERTGRLHEADDAAEHHQPAGAGDQQCSLGSEPGTRQTIVESDQDERQHGRELPAQEQGPQVAGLPDVHVAHLGGIPEPFETLDHVSEMQILPLP